jgi:hypothetical protein
MDRFPLLPGTVDKSELHLSRFSNIKRVLTRAFRKSTIQGSLQ